MNNARPPQNLLAAVCLAAGCTHMAAAQTGFRLIDGFAAAGGQVWDNSSRSGPSIWFGADNAQLAPPPVALGSAAGTARVEYAYGPFGATGASVVPWAEATLALNSQSCGTLDITMNARLNLGIADAFGTLYNVQPTVQWLMDNDVASFSGTLGAGAAFLLEATVDDCGICLPDGIFEVDLDSTPVGSWESWSGCLPQGTHLLQLMGGGLSEEWAFSWDRDTQTLLLPTGFDGTWTIRIPAPGSACLLAAGGLLASRRRR